MEEGWRYGNFDAQIDFISSGT